MKSEEAMYFADLTETWGAERRYNLMGARIKWLFTGNYGYPPVSVSEQEAAAEALWTPWSPAVSRSTKPWNPAAVEIRRAVARHKQEQLGAYKIDKQLLRKTLKQALRDRFGKPSSGGRYVTKVGDLLVSTHFDFGVRWGAQFGYSQMIETRQLDRICGHGGILTLLGSPQTRWGRLTNDDIPATANLVAQLCGEFVDAVPEMWERSGLANAPLPDGVT